MTQGHGRNRSNKTNSFISITHPPLGFFPLSFLLLSIISSLFILSVQILSVNRNLAKREYLFLEELQGSLHRGLKVRYQHQHGSRLHRSDCSGCCRSPLVGCMSFDLHSIGLRSHTSMVQTLRDENRYLFFNMSLRESVLTPISIDSQTTRQGNLDQWCILWTRRGYCSSIGKSGSKDCHHGKRRYT